jgi:2-hydroxy-6-oxonona-2,4-dienedioate hydrolase
MSVLATAPVAVPPPPPSDPPDEEQRWTQVEGGRVHGRCWLDPHLPADPVVVLVHGLGVASRTCPPVAQRLARRYHVYAPDLPGFGRSDKPERVLDVVELGDALAAWCRATGLRDVVLVGTSLGSQVAAEAARRHPGLARAVVLGSPTVDAGRRRWPLQVALWQAEQATQSMRMRSIVVRDVARCGVGRMVRTFRSAFHHRVEDTVAEVRVPVLVCLGTHDPLLSRRWAETLAGRAPDGELRVLPGAAHALSHENPLELGRVVTHFVVSRT